MFGQNTNPKNQGLKDLNKTEWAMLLPAIIFIVWIGINSTTFTNFSENSTRQLINKLEQVKFGTDKIPYPIKDFQKLNKY